MTERGMNNVEREQAALLRKHGFEIFWQGAPGRGCYWAKHYKLTSQYALGKKQHEIVTQAIQDVLDVINPPVKQDESSTSTRS
jgi:hypothetical protein